MRTNRGKRTDTAESVIAHKIQSAGPVFWTQVLRPFCSGSWIVRMTAPVPLAPFVLFLPPHFNPYTLWSGSLACGLSHRQIWTEPTLSFPVPPLRSSVCPSVSLPQDLAESWLWLSHHTCPAPKATLTSPQLLHENGRKQHPQAANLLLSLPGISEGPQRPVGPWATAVTNPTVDLWEAQCGSSQMA